VYTIERLVRGGPATIDHPIEHLLACHDRIEERLKVLERAAEHLESRPEEARAALQACFRYFETSGVLHTADEEESVFPRMRGRISAQEEEYLALAGLEAQHREADALYAELRQGPGDVARHRDVVARFCALYREHIATENRDLVEAARRVLREGELHAIAGEMKRRRGLIPG